MSFCRNCGAQLEEGTLFCPSCGAKQEAEPEYRQATAYTSSEQENKQENKGGLFDTTDRTSEFDPQDIEDNKILALFSYLGILFLIPLLAAKDSKYAQYHAYQGIALFVVEIVLGAIFSVVIIPVLGWIIGIADGIASLACTIFAIVGIVNAVTGKAKGIPVAEFFAKKMFKGRF